MQCAQFWIGLLWTQQNKDLQMTYYDPHAGWTGVGATHGSFVLSNPATAEIEMWYQGNQIKLRHYSFDLTIMDNLPPEILKCIFELACTIVGPLGLSYRLIWFTYPPSIPVQHQLLMVSRLWRDVAISTQSLWTTISLYYMDREVWRQEEMLRFLRPVLGYSGTALLDIHVSSCWNIVAEYLIPESYRWRMLGINESDGAYADLSCFANLQGKLPLLEVFEFAENTLDPSQRPQAIEWLSDAFSRSSSIREVSCCSEILEVRFPWHQLTRLEVKFTPSPIQAMDDAARFKRLLESCKSLQSLTVDGRPALALHYRNTAVQEFICPNVSWLWFLILPAVRKLKLRGFANTSYTDYFPLCIDFIQRSQCLLVSLQLPLPLLAWASTTVSSFHSILKLVPHLQLLLLEAHDEYGESPPPCYPVDIPPLCQPLHDPNVLPALVSFTIKLECGKQRSTEDCIEAFRVWVAVVGDVVGARRASMETFFVTARVQRDGTKEPVTQENLESMVETSVLQARAREMRVKGQIWVKTVCVPKGLAASRVSDYDILFRVLS
ncbi:hypothetical protein CYLTODRAFT_443881 [Cylindrobasidium torrendii FP15055 ss-10]|uniref:Uncharacterized protein n=1 Tax=Cylindrobasidium torrendii FP15055 ss-10 TaxID=1314674 RepID=A0A0D7BC13_9AGAR|nr:hypothetical protein CYLTODRAFT_443881 [Cylindrobasidium torrendii FP15055 ss-10]